MTEASPPSSRLQAAARRAALGPTRQHHWPLPPTSALLVIHAGIVFVCTLIMLIIWRHPVDGPAVLPGIDAFATALMWSNALWLALSLAELAACRIKRTRIRWRRALVLLGAVALTGLLQGLAQQLREFGQL